MILPSMILQKPPRPGFRKIMKGKFMVVSAQSETNLDRWGQCDLGLSRPSLRRPSYPRLGTVSESGENR
jgi:hypothetical protein